MTAIRVFGFTLLLSIASHFAGCSPQHPQPLGPGATAPPLTVPSWINGEGPTPEELAGKVVVVDVWAFWCQPCRQAIPELIKVYDRYQDRDDIVFLGLTHVGNEGRESSKDFVRELRIPWVNGISARRRVQTRLQAYALPMVFVIGRDGKNRLEFRRPRRHDRRHRHRAGAAIRSI